MAAGPMWMTVEFDMRMGENDTNICIHLFISRVLETTVGLVGLSLASHHVSDLCLCGCRCRCRCGVLLFEHELQSTVVPQYFPAWRRRLIPCGKGEGEGRSRVAWRGWGPYIRTLPDHSEHVVTLSPPLSSPGKPHSPLRRWKSTAFLMKHASLRSLP